MSRRWSAALRCALCTLLAVGSALLGVLAAPSAQAHDRLLSSSPADGADVPAPDAVVLTFAREVLRTGAAVRVTGSDGAVSGVLSQDGAVLTHRFAAPLSPGRYAVAWRVVSSDSHPLSGRLDFVVTAAATTPSPAAVPTPTPGSSEASPGGGWGVGLVLVLVVAAALSTALVVRARRGHGRRDAPQ